MGRKRAKTDEERCEKTWNRPKAGLVRCVYIAGHAGDHEAPKLLPNGKRPALITPAERERNDAIGLARQVLTLIECNHAKRDEILRVSARKHLLRWELARQQDLDRRRAAGQLAEEGRPRWPHDCLDCTWLGQHGVHDLWFCTQGGTSPTVIARFGAPPDNYTSGLALAGLSLPLSKAAALARARGLLP